MFSHSVSWFERGGWELLTGFSVADVIELAADWSVSSCWCSCSASWVVSWVLRWVCLFSLCVSGAQTRTHARMHARTHATHHTHTHTLSAVCLLMGGWWLTLFNMKKCLMLFILHWFSISHRLSHTHTQLTLTHTHTLTLTRAHAHAHTHTHTQLSERKCYGPV